MTNSEIIAYWKAGYTVDQIVAKNPISNKLIDDFPIRHRIEKVILNYYQKGEKWED